ncbi:MAG: carboxypeptidase-like regulatory domain-containing protein, partial [Chitinophagaceae bacterium]
MRKYLRLLLSGVFLVFTCNLLAQDKSVSGIVIADDDNSPLRDVTVTVKGTNNRTKTNDVGRFTLNAKAGQVLVFTFVDYGKQE